jgi:hypothetical protein
MSAWYDALTDASGIISALSDDDALNCEWLTAMADHEGRGELVRLALATICRLLLDDLDEQTYSPPGTALARLREIVASAVTEQPEEEPLCP